MDTLLTDPEEIIGLRAIVEGTARHTGNEFFRSLVRNLSLATKVPNAFVAEFADSQKRIRSLAFWSNGQIIPNEEWDLAGTPCEDVLKGSFCHHPKDVRIKFPNDPGSAKIESYLGVPLRDVQSVILGHLAIYDVKPMPPEPRLLCTFEIFAARAAAELERLRAERQLRESEERYRDLYQEAPNAYVSLDLQGRLLTVNQQATSLLGYPAAELLGTYLMDHGADSPEGKARITSMLQMVQRGEPIQGMEIELRRQDGTPLWWSVWIKPMRTNQGKVQTGRTIGVDITDRIQAEQDKQRLLQQSQYLQEEIQSEHNFEEIVGRSPKLLNVLQKIGRVATTDSTVLIIGETGTGKELIARAIHSASPRKDKPFIKLNCAALPTGLVESELFGHEKGAFTGAACRRLGRFELADGGTLFLDEIGELPLDTQAKLLRVLQENELDRVGGSTPIRINVRILAATNRNLAQMVKEKTFREDLFYRLNVFPIELPALRERKDDIPLLTPFLVKKFASRIGKRIDPIDPETMQMLLNYPWPGNIRELANVLERAVILSNGPTLEIDPDQFAMPVTDVPIPNEPQHLHKIEIEHIRKVLQQTYWVIEGPNGAAKILGLHPNTLRSRMKKWGIIRPS